MSMPKLSSVILSCFLLVSISFAQSSLNVEYVGETPRRWGPISAMTTNGNYTYVYTIGTGLIVLDSSDPDNPEEVGSVDLGISLGPKKMVISGTKLYLDDGYNTIHVVSISNPGNPSEQGSLNTSYSLFDWDVYGSYIYATVEDAIGDEWEDGLKIYYAGSPSNIVERGEIVVEGAESIVAANGYVYISATQGFPPQYGLQAVNVSSATSPSLGNFCSTGYTRPGRMILRDNHIYGVGSLGGFRVYTVSGASVSLTGSATSQVRAVDLVADDDYVYAASGNQGVFIFDVSSPSSPSEVGTAPYDDFSDADAVSVAGNYLYVGDPSLGLSIGSISSPENITFVGGIFSYSNLNKVGVSDNENTLYGFIEDFGICTFDISNRANPTELDTLISSRGSGPFDADFDNEYGFVTNYTHFNIADLSDPSDPEMISYFYQGGRTMMFVKVHNSNYAYILDDTAYFTVMDISNINNPQIVGSTLVLADDQYYGMDLDFDNRGYCYVAHRGLGVTVVDISSPTSASVVGTYDTPGSVTKVFVEGNRLYAVAGDEGVYIFNISNPSNLTLLGNYSFLEGAYASDISVNNDIAFIAYGYYGLRVVDLSDPTDPVDSGYYYLEGENVNNVFTKDDHIYLPMGNQVLLLDYVDNGEDTRPPNVSFTANGQPDAGEELYTGSTFTIGFSATDNVGVATINLFYSLDDGSSWTTINSSPLAGTATSYEWTLPQSTTTQAKIKVEATDDSSNVGYVISNTFSIVEPDLENPVVSFIEGGVPLQGEIVEIGSEFLIGFSASDNRSVSIINVYYSNDNGSSWSRLNTNNLPGNTTSYNWSVPSTPANQSKLKVEALDSSDNMGQVVSSTFVVGELPRPNPFELTSPVDGDSVFTLTPTLYWEQQGDPDGVNPHFDVWLSNDAQMTDKTLIADSIEANQFTVSPLADNATYYWQVRATDTNTSGRWSTVEGFTVYVPEEPTAFNLIEPANDITIFNDEITFRWTRSLNPDPGDISYKLYLAEDSEFTQNLQVVATSDTVYTVTGLEGLTHYYWKVKAENHRTNGTWSDEERTFYLPDLVHPTGFSLISPTHDSVTGRYVTFKWESSINPDGGTQHYDVWLSTRRDFHYAELVADSIADTTFSLSNVDAARRYYWAVRATDDDSEGTWADDTLSFVASPGELVERTGYCFLEEEATHDSIFIEYYLRQESSTSIFLGYTESDGFYDIFVEPSDETSGEYYNVYGSYPTFVPFYVDSCQITQAGTEPDQLLAMHGLAGDISGTLEPVTYTVYDYVSVPAGQELIIPAGAEILFRHKYNIPGAYTRFDCYGDIYIQGTETDSVIIKSDPDDPFPESPDRRSYYALTMETDSRLEMDYCRLDGGLMGITSHLADSLFIRNTIIENSDYYGLSCSNIEYVDVVNTVFRNNGSTEKIEANNNLRCGAVSLNARDARFTDCLFEGNRSGRHAPGIYSTNGGSVLIDRCDFRNNDVVQNVYGSAFEVDFTGDTVPPEFVSISNSNFTDNTGGNAVIYAPSAMISDSKILRNTAGGVSKTWVYNNENEFHEISRTIIANNQSFGIYVKNLQLLESTIVNNGSHGINFYKMLVMTNSIVMNHGVNVRNLDIPDETVDISYNIFYNEDGSRQNFPEQYYPAGLGVLSETNTNGDSTDVFGNLLIDPLFENYTGDDFRLTLDSPAIDAGDPNGMLDPDGSRKDIGAIPYDPNVPQNPSPFSILYPAGNDTVSEPTPTLVWERSVDNNLDETPTYQVLISQNDDLSSPIINLEGLSDTTVALTEALSDDQTFYWAVYASDPTLSGTWSDTVMFQTFFPESPSAFAMTWPANNSTVHDDTITVRWQNTIDPDPNDELYFQVEWSETSDFSVVYSATTTDTFYTLTGLNDPEVNGSPGAGNTGSMGMKTTGYIKNSSIQSMFNGNAKQGRSGYMTDALPDGGTIYWRVKAVCQYGDATWANGSDGGWSFDINVIEGPPDIHILSPIAGMNLEMNSDVTIEWELSGTDQIDHITVSYSYGNSTTWNEIITITGYATSCVWTTPEIPSLDAKIKIELEDLNGGTNSTETDGVFSVGAVYTEKILQGNWHLFSLPVSEKDHCLAATTIDDINGNSFVYSYNANTGYFILAETDTLQNGYGYWLYKDSSVDTLTQNGIPKTYSRIDLEQGWNLIGGVTETALLNQHVHVRRNEQQLVWGAAANNGWVANLLYTYNPETMSYQDEDAIQAWNGYWIYSEEENLELIVDVDGSEAENDDQDGSELDDLDNWSIPIYASIENIESSEIKIGVADDAGNNYDPQYDRYAPPNSPVGQYLNLYFLHEDWDTSLDKFSTDIVSPLLQNEEYHWDITVESSVNGEITFDFTSISENLPESKLIQLAASAENFNLRETPLIQLNYEGSPFEMTITVQHQASSVEYPFAGIPTEFAIEKTYPNPFNPTVNVVIAVPQISLVQLEVYNVLGQKMAVLNNRALEAGYHHFAWTNEGSTGVYFLRMSSDTGWNAVQKLIYVK